MSVGDITSTARGTGARFNDGKVPLELLPLRQAAAYLLLLENHSRVGRAISQALSYLGEFQAGGGREALLDCMASIEVAMHAMLPGDGPDEHCPLRAAARVFDYGRRKYAAWNWSKGMAWSVPIGCAARHLFAMLSESKDPESGLPHAGHAACNVLMLMTYLDTYPEGDDRPTMLRPAGGDSRPN